MHKSEWSLPEPCNRILVVIYQGIGDLVLATAALRAIRERFPKAHLAVAGRSHCVDILLAESYIDELIGMPSRLTRLSELRDAGRLLAHLRRRRFDLLINLTTLLNLSTYLKCSGFNRLCGAKCTIAGRLRDCLTFWPRRTAVKFRLPIHEATMKFHLADGLLRANDQPSPRLTLASTTRSRTDLDPPTWDRTVRRPSIGVCAGGAKQTHRWPVERFVECVRRLAQEFNAHVILLGDSNDVQLGEVVERSAAVPLTNLTGQLPLSKLPGFVAGLDALLTNDTGLMHIAAAVGTPLVAIFGAGTPQRYMPLGNAETTIVFFRPFSCGPCLLNHCGHRRCTMWIRSDEVVTAIDSVLRHSAPGRSLPVLVEPGRPQAMEVVLR